MIRIKCRLHLTLITFQYRRKITIHSVCSLAPLRLFALSCFFCCTSIRTIKKIEMFLLFFLSTSAEHEICWGRTRPIKIGKKPTKTQWDRNKVWQLCGLGHIKWCYVFDFLISMNLGLWTGTAIVKSNNKKTTTMNICHSHAKRNTEKRDNRNCPFYWIDATNVHDRVDKDEMKTNSTIRILFYIRVQTIIVCSDLMILLL